MRVEDDSGTGNRENHRAACGETAHSRGELTTADPAASGAGDLGDAVVAGARGWDVIVTPDTWTRPVTVIPAVVVTAGRSAAPVGRRASVQVGREVG